MLLDSNIVIYAAKPGGAALRSFLEGITRYVSVVSYIESFGYQNLTPQEFRQLETIFLRAQILPLTDAIADQAISLRQQRRMGLGDGKIAATAMTRSMALITHNTEDFRWIAGLELLDPLSNLP